MIRTQADLDDALDALLSLDPRLGPVAALAGPLPLRPMPTGLPGLAATIMGQQVSRASAEAIFARLAAEIDLADPHAILRAEDAAFRRAGLSAAKHRAVIALAEAVASGAVDFPRIGVADAETAVRELTAVRGIGRWTAESYLLFALGHRDVFPAGDLALQIAVARAAGPEDRIREKPLVALAETWSPLRSIAARLFWAYYAAITRRDGTPAPIAPSVGDGG